MSNSSSPLLCDLNSWRTFFLFALSLWLLKELTLLTTLPCRSRWTDAHGSPALLHARTSVSALHRLTVTDCNYKHNFRQTGTKIKFILNKEFDARRPTWNCAIFPVSWQSTLARVVGGVFHLAHGFRMTGMALAGSKKVLWRKSVKGRVCLSKEKTETTWNGRIWILSSFTRSAQGQNVSDDPLAELRLCRNTRSGRQEPLLSGRPPS